MKVFKFRVSVPKVVTVTGKNMKQARNKALKTVLRGKRKPKGSTAKQVGRAVSHARRHYRTKMPKM